MTKPHTLLGVPGSLELTPAHQEFTTAWRNVTLDRANCAIQTQLRFDDRHGNGHATFTITATINQVMHGRLYAHSSGCCHTEIAQAFPELAHLIRWHLCSTDGPTHYPGNAVYLAGDHDHNGKRKGEPWAWDEAIYFGNSPVSHKLKNRAFAKFLMDRMERDQDGGWYLKRDSGEFRVVAIPYVSTKQNDYKFQPKYTFVGFGEKWHDCPFDEDQTAQEWASALNHLRCEFDKVPTLFSEGKARELEGARRCAVWPEVTDEELCVEPEVLKAKLMERLPALMEAFKKDMEAAGLIWR